MSCKFAIKSIFLYSTFLLYDNNFATDEFGLDDITEQKFEVTEIQNTETDEINQPVISFTDEK